MYRKLQSRVSVMNQNHSTIYKLFFCFTQRSSLQVDDLLSHGQTMLQNLRDQRVTLKGIQKKVLDVASVLVCFIDKKFFV